MTGSGREAPVPEDTDAVSTGANFADVCGLAVARRKPSYIHAFECIELGREVTARFRATETGYPELTQSHVATPWT